jgi:general stress protein 26
MSEREPRTEFEPEFSEDTAQATAWGDGRKAIEQAEVYWLSTVRPDDRPHVTPLLAVWQDDALHFCTGADERKAKNLEHNPHCVLTTGNNALHGGLDIVVEGDAVRVRGTETLQRLADGWEQKYGPEWHFDVGDGAFTHEAGEALVFAVAPAKAFGFGKGPYSQTRWRFG